MKTTYYISTGALGCFYTLRCRFVDWGHNRATGEIYRIPRDYYVKNLSTDRDKAIAAAHEYTGEDLSCAFDLNDIERREDPIDWSMFQTGKYAGRPLLDVLAEDRDYVLFICENWSHSAKYHKTCELAMAYIERDLVEREMEREITATIRRANRARCIAILAPFASALAQHGGEFCTSVAADMRDGYLPSGRGHSIVIDILAKERGRRNSKAYMERYEELCTIFDLLS